MKGKAKGSKKTGGRVKGTPNKAKLEIREIIDNSGIDFSVVVLKLFELVKGVTVAMKTPDGIPVIYEKAPDPSAAKILLEYRFGRPQQSVDLTSGGEPLMPATLNFNGGNPKSRP